MAVFCSPVAVEPNTEFAILVAWQCAPPHFWPTLQGPLDLDYPIQMAKPRFIDIKCYRHLHVTLHHDRLRNRMPALGGRAGWCPVGQIATAPPRPPHCEFPIGMPFFANSPATFWRGWPIGAGLMCWESAGSADITGRRTVGFKGVRKDARTRDRGGLSRPNGL